MRATGLAGMYSGEQRRKPYLYKAMRVGGKKPIAYWPLSDRAGTVAVEMVSGLHGAYAASRTLNVGGIGDGKTCAQLGTATINLYSAGLASVFNGAEGTLALWLKASSSATWNPAGTSTDVYIGADEDNRIRITTSSSTDLSFLYEAGGTEELVTVDTSNTLAWMHLAITWSATADAMIAYYNGQQTGDTQTVLGAWAGALATTLVKLNYSGKFPGFYAHAMLWNSALSPANIAVLYKVP